jgi:hypothetical protein
MVRAARESGLNEVFSWYARWATLGFARGGRPAFVAEQHTAVCAAKRRQSITLWA